MNPYGWFVLYSIRSFLISLLVKTKNILLLQSCIFCLLYQLNNFRKLKTIKHSYTRSTFLDVNRTQVAFYLIRFIRFNYSFSVVFLSHKQKSAVRSKRKQWPRQVRICSPDDKIKISNRLYDYVRTNLYAHNTIEHDIEDFNLRL